MATTKIGAISFGVQMNTARLQRDAKRSTRIISNFSKSGSRLLKVFGATAAAGTVAAALRSATRGHEALNKSMRRSLAVMGDVSDTMSNRMRQAAIDMSRTTTASADQVAEAYFFLASAGLNAEQALSALPTVTKFASAGNFDLATATDLLTDAQSALGLSVKDTAENMRNMTRVSDVLIKANTVANATAQQFSEALTNKAGAALRLLGKEVEEGVAVLSVFADQGVKGTEAGTALSVVLRDLQTKAINFKKEFAQAGVAVFDTGGEMRKVSSIVEDLEGKLIGLSDRSKKKFLLDLGFSDKSVAFIQALIGTSSQIASRESQLLKGAGMTDTVAGKMFTPLEKATSELRASITQLGDALSPLIAGFATLTRHIAGMAEATFGPADISKNGKIRKHKESAGSEAIRAMRLAGDAVFRKGGMGRTRAALGVGPGAKVSPQKSKFDKYSQARSATQGWGSGQLGLGGMSSVAGFLGSDVKRTSAMGKQAGKKLGSIFDAARNFAGEQKANIASRAAAFSSGRKALGGVVPGLIGKAQAAMERGKMGVWSAQLKRAQTQVDPGQGGSGLAFAEAGSAESFRQRARIKKQSEETKLAKKRTQDLEKMREIMEKNPIVLAVAGLMK